MTQSLICIKSVKNRNFDKIYLNSIKLGNNIKLNVLKLLFTLRFEFLPSCDLLIQFFDAKRKVKCNHFPKFLICSSILKRFYLHWKAFDLLNKMRYILGVVALLLACDVTNNGHHLGRQLGFYQELEIKHVFWPKIGLTTCYLCRHIS